MSAVFGCYLLMFLRFLAEEFHLIETAFVYQVILYLEVDTEASILMVYVNVEQELLAVIYL